MIQIFVQYKWNNIFQHLYQDHIYIQVSLQLAQMSPGLTNFNWDLPKSSHFRFLQWQSSPKFSEMSSGLIKLNYCKHPCTYCFSHTDNITVHIVSHTQITSLYILFLTHRQHPCTYCFSHTDNITVHIVSLTQITSLYILFLTHR